MTPAQRQIYDDIVASRGTWLNGPFAPMLLQPEIAEPAQRLGEFVRYNTSLEPQLSELAILLVARHNDCEFEWYQHKRVALSSGLDPAIVEAIRNDDQPDGLEGGYLAVWRITTELLKANRISDASYNQGKALFGEVGMVELIGLIGYYTLIAFTLNAHEVPMPKGAVCELGKLRTEIAAV
jgi:4-carboxymuconolactone decarboxylase